jgi:hypothetical protein
MNLALCNGILDGIIGVVYTAKNKVDEIPSPDFDVLNSGISLVKATTRTTNPWERATMGTCLMESYHLVLNSRYRKMSTMDTTQ